MVALAQLLSQGDASQGGILVSPEMEGSLWSQLVFISHSHEMMVVQAEGPYRKLVTRLLEGGIIRLLIERMFDTASTVSAPQPTVDEKTCCCLQVSHLLHDMSQQVRLHAAGTLR